MLNAVFSGGVFLLLGFAWCLGTRARVRILERFSKSKPTPRDAVRHALRWPLDPARAVRRARDLAGVCELYREAKEPRRRQAGLVRAALRNLFGRADERNVAVVEGELREEGRAGHDGDRGAEERVRGSATDEVRGRCPPETPTRVSEPDSAQICSAYTYKQADKRVV